MPIVDATHKQTYQSHLCCDPIGFTCLDFLEILTYYISGMDNKSKKACKIELWFEGAEKIEREGEGEFFFQNREILEQSKRSNDENRRLIILMLVIVVMMAERWQWAGERGGVGAPGMNYDAWATAHQPACH